MSKVSSVYSVGANGAAGLQSNGLGLGGFIVSLVGLVASCGLISPIGLVLSLFGLRKQPRGFAVAGVVLGLIGSLWLIAAIALGLFAAALATVGLAAAATEMSAMESIRSTEASLNATRDAIVAYESQVSKPVYALPLLEPTYLNTADVVDAWGRPIEFELTPENEYRLRSAGPDQTPDTHDDITVEFESSITAPAISTPTLHVVPPRQPL